MAFSFRIGTKWCHDFPKLAKESGFFFNMHKSRVRIDWNCISNIDIDRIIRERDFYSIDDNINNVIDYCFESEYDIKILDPNFVKLFRLAQLAVEYLLYCKQYLDHSVIILKDELKLKIEENVKLKKEITTLEEVVKHMKEKAKERSKLIETKIGDCNGEIYKCPHCPKNFISPMFVSIHIIRRHAYASDLYTPHSPIHEQYRTETEKLHNEIKALKERLNETEKVIRNESEKVPEKRMLNYDKKPADSEVENIKYNDNKPKEHSEYKGYQEEIKNLKTMLFDEIHNLRQKEKSSYERTSETNVQTLINQQEKEFQKLKNQLLEKLTPDIEGMHTKLYAQENYWMSKIEHLENQHHKDIERLTAELKLTQQAADDMKAKYETKVSDLERQTANQTNILTEQSKQLHSLSSEINVSQLNEKNNENNSLKEYNQSIVLDKSNKISKQSDENSMKQSECMDTKVEQITVGNEVIDTTSSDLSNKVFPLNVDQLLKNVHSTNSRNKSTICKNKQNIKEKSKKSIKNAYDHVRNFEKDLECHSSNDILDSEDLMSEEGNKRTKCNHSTIKTDLNKSGIGKLEDTFSKNTSNEFSSNTKSIKTWEPLEDNLFSTVNSELSVSDSNTDSITTIHDNSPLHECKTHSPLSLKSKQITEYSSLYKRLQIDLKEAFEQKLRDLGIDPDWQGIPTATFKQKMDILKHHHRLAVKKSPKYHKIKVEIIEEILNKIFRKEKEIKNLKQLKKSSHKTVTNVRSMAVKKFNKKKDSDNHISTLQSVTSNNFHSIPESNHAIKNIIENESTPVKITKTEDLKTIENLTQISSNPIKFLEDTTNLQEHPLRKNSLNKMKPLFNSDMFKITPNDKSISNNKSVQDSTDHSNIQQELQNIFISPKHNKSVLKSTSGSTSSLTKKKVIFDLTNKEDKESSSNDDVEKEKLNENNWNTLSISNERTHLSESEKHKSSNIVLKTTQSDKIAELSKKLEAQLNIVRQKPIGSVETIFSSRYIPNKGNQSKNNEQINSISISSVLDYPFQASGSKKRNESLPQPAPRNLRDKISDTLHTESISEISDLDSDIDKILKVE